MKRRAGACRGHLVPTEVAGDAGKGPGTMGSHSSHSQTVASFSRAPLRSGCNSEGLYA